MNKKAAEQQRAVRSMETPEQYSEFEDSVIEAAKTQAQRIIDDARRQGDANFDKLMEGTGATHSSPTGKRPRTVWPAKWPRSSRTTAKSCWCTAASL